jgi:hypothetical protein
MLMFCPWFCRGLKTCLRLPIVLYSCSSDEAGDTAWASFCTVGLCAAANFVWTRLKQLAGFCNDSLQQAPVAETLATGLS